MKGSSDLSDHLKGKNRFGKDVMTNIPSDAPFADSPGHKLRTSNTIVDRKVLAAREKDILEKRMDSKLMKKGKDQELEFVEFENELGIIRKNTTWKDEEENPIPNQFKGPSFRNKKEKFRFDGHKMMHHLDRILAWQNDEKFAPIHIDMGLTKFCNTACIYCYAVVQNMTKGVMIQRDALIRYK